MKKILKIVLIIAIILIIGIFAVVMFQMYKPVLDSSKEIDEVSNYPLSYQAKWLGTYYLRFDDLKDNEKLNSIVTGKMPTGSLGEGFNPLNKLLPGTIRLYAPPADLYDGMIFVYEASPFTILNDGM